MHRTLAIFSSLAFAFAAAGSIGCSSSSTPVTNTEASASDAGGSDGAAATVSFSKDVMPFFQTGCTLTSECHGQANNISEENLFLGANDGSTDPKSIYAMLVGVPSVEDPSMNLVTAGDTSKSYLFHKLVGDQNTFGTDSADCNMASSLCTMDCNAQQPCGQFMPYNGVQLGSSDYAVVTNWIEQGAVDN